MTSQAGFQTIPIHILPNISQKKRQPVMKFGQLIEQEKYFSSKVMRRMRQGD